MQFTDEDMKSILANMVLAEANVGPGPAKHWWVVGEELRRHTRSPMIPWAWILVEVLNILIPKLLEWLKKKFGDQWPDQVTASLQAGKLPWQS